MISVIAEAAVGYARGRYFVIVDGIVGRWFLSPSQRQRIPLHYIVLRPPLATSLARARTGAQALVASAPIRALHSQFADLGRYERHAIDSAA